MERSALPNAVAMRARYLITGVFFLFGLSACSGSPALHQAQTPPASVQATFVFTVPGKTPQSFRNAAYLTSTVREIDISVNAGPALVFMVPGPGTYQFNVGVPPGNDTFLVTTYNLSHGLISSASVSQMITQGGGNTVTAATLPVANTLRVLLAKPTLFVGGGAQTSAVSLLARDVDGNNLSGLTLANPIVFSVSAGSSQITFSPASVPDTSTPVTLNYTGSAVSPTIVQVLAASGAASASAPFATDYHIYVGANDISNNAFILSIDAASPATQSATSNLTNDQISQIAINAAGTAGYYGTNTSAQLRAFSISAGTPTLGGATGLANPLYVAASTDGTKFFAGNGNNMYQITGSVAAPALSLIAAQSGQQFLASDGINMYTAPNVGPNTVYGFPIAGGPSVSDNLGGGATTATNVVIGGSTLFVGDTGAAKALSAFPLPLAGCPPCGQQTGITATNFVGPVVNPQGTRAFILDSSNGKLLPYGVGTGASLTPLTQLTGLALSQTVMTIDPAGGYVYMTQTSGSVVTIYRVNTQTGAQTSFNASVGSPYTLRALATGL